jgi:DNA-binding NarL/FixJ family response regulator
VTDTQTSARRSGSNKPKTILIADDSAMVRTIIRQAIERDTEFVVCAEAGNGADAVTKAKELAPDLIILDVVMPGLNGIEVAGILRHALPRIRIVLLTMYAEDFDKSYMSLFRIDAVTSKANGLMELTTLVAGLLANEQADSTTPGDTVDGHLAARQQE